MGAKRKELSQAEVWDDTALLQSWNDALEEYKASLMSPVAYSFTNFFSSTTAFMPKANASKMSSKQPKRKRIILKV